VTVWAAGFAVHPIAAASGLAVQDDGRITADRMTRSVSHPNVYAAGDSAYVIGENGRPLPMSCASAGFTRMQATAAIVGDLTGHKISKTSLDYLGNCISLGGKDAIFQAVDGDARSKLWSLRGRPAARFKAFVLRGAAWNMGHPTYGLPTRRRRRASAPNRTPAAIAG
jgi:NADH dehydrogenase FAD-containing subunit